MAPSKKKMKNIAKAAKRMSPKAKKKAKDVMRIKRGVQKKDLKRLGAAATRREDWGSAEKDLRDELSSVDQLFASLGEDGEEEVPDACSDASDASESSGGEFVDGDDDEDEEHVAEGAADEDLDELEGLTGPTAGAQHMEELKALREKDPEFYAFLMNQDKALLDFEAPKEDEKAEGEEDVAGEGTAEQARHEKTVRLLNAERVAKIQEMAKQSWTSMKVAVSAYHTAVTSISGRRDQKDEDEEEGKKKKKDKTDKKGRRTRAYERKKAKPSNSKSRMNEMVIPDAAMFSAIIEWSLANLTQLFQHHAGELLPPRPAKGEKQKKPWGHWGKKGKKREAHPAEPSNGVVDTTCYKRWSSVKIMARIFWQDTLFLLQHASGTDMVEFLLRHVSSQQALQWLWPFSILRKHFLQRCSTVWTVGATQNVRLLAFLFLRNYGAMTQLVPDKRRRIVVPQFEEALRTVTKSFSNAATGGYSWRSIGAFRFMENCYVELLRMDDATAYRLGYICIRQLAIVLRNACMNFAKASSKESKKQERLAISMGKKKATAAKAKKKKQLAMQQVESLVTWQFVRGTFLWTRAVGTVPTLKPLAYPLSMVIMGAVKNRIMRLKEFPFVLHCLRCVNDLGASLEAFVPISSHLLKLLYQVMQAIEKSVRKHKKSLKSSRKGEEKPKVKMPEVEVLLRITEAQTTDLNTLEAIGVHVFNLLTDHLGLLSRSPAYPELVSPVLLHVRKCSRTCKSEPMRRQAKAFLQTAEAAQADVRARREQLTEPPPLKQFLVFPPDNAMARARESMLSRRQAEEKSRVETEIKEAANPKDKKQKLEDLDDEEEEQPSEKKGKISRSQKRKLKAAKLAEEENQRKQARTAVVEQAKKAVKAAGRGAREDVVEEMGFSSGED